MRDVEQARQFPGEEERMIDFLQKNPRAMERVAAPVYEDKVIDFILEAATITDKRVSVEELMKSAEENEDKAVRKKVGSKKSKKEAAAENAEGDPPVEGKAASKTNSAVKKTSAKKAAANNVEE